MNNSFALAKIMKSVHSPKHHVSQGLRKPFTLTIKTNNISLPHKQNKPTIMKQTITTHNIRDKNLLLPVSYLTKSLSKGRYL